MKSTISAILGGLVGLAAGAVGTYYISKRRIEIKYAILLDEEVANVKDYYRLLRKENGDIVFAGEMDEEYEGYGELDDEEAELEDRYQNVIEEEGYSAEEPVKNTPPTSKNVFKDIEESPEEPEEEIFPVKYEQLPEPTPDRPYVIGTDDWVLGRVGNVQYDKRQLTYYDGDDTLVDQDSKIIQDREGIIGLSNLSKFGLASDNNDIVYVRNEAMETDFEVFKEDAEYSVKVLGLPSEYLSKGGQKFRKLRDDE